MKKNKELLGKPAQFTAYVFIAILIVSVFCASFWLMNQVSTLSFVAGLLLFTFTLALSINYIQIQIKKTV